MADPLPDESTMFEEKTNKWVGPERFTFERLAYPPQRYDLH